MDEPVLIAANAAELALSSSAHETINSADASFTLRQDTVLKYKTTVTRFVALQTQKHRLQNLTKELKNESFTISGQVTNVSMQNTELELTYPATMRKIKKARLRVSKSKMLYESEVHKQQAFEMEITALENTLQQVNRDIEKNKVEIEDGQRNVQEHSAQRLALERELTEACAQLSQDETACAAVNTRAATLLNDLETQQVATKAGQDAASTARNDLTAAHARYDDLTRSLQVSKDAHAEAIAEFEQLQRKLAIATTAWEALTVEAKSITTESQTMDVCISASHAEWVKVQQDCAVAERECVRLRFERDGKRIEMQKIRAALISSHELLLATQQRVCDVTDEITAVLAETDGLAKSLRTSPSTQLKRSLQQQQYTHFAQPNEFATQLHPLPSAGASLPSTPPPIHTTDGIRGNRIGEEQQPLASSSIFIAPHTASGAKDVNGSTHVYGNRIHPSHYHHLSLPSKSIRTNVELTISNDDESVVATRFCHLALRLPPGVRPTK